MADDHRLDIKKAIADNSRMSDLAGLANSGIKRVKVLDEQGLQDLILQAIDRVVSNQTAEERSRILADSRKQLQKLMDERDKGFSKADMLEASRNELIKQIEVLDKELKLRREVDSGNAELQKKLQALEQENASLRDQNDRTVEELDQARTEIKRLQAEIEDLKRRLIETQSMAADAAEELASTREAAETATAALRQEFERLREAAEARIPFVVPDHGKEEEQVLEEVPPPAPAPKPAPLPKAASAPLSSPRPPAVTRTSPLKPGKGLDIGTVNLVAAAQQENGETELRLQRNVFLDIESTAYTKAMLTKLNVAYAVQGGRMFILGEPAFQLANVLNRRTRRPMKDGLISPKEQNALPIMKLLIGSILEAPCAENEVCFYSVPGDPVDSDLSVSYHRDLFDAALQSLGYKPSHILEGHAVTFAELAEDDFTGIGVSCGGGMFNVCVAYKSMPALSFSTSRSGDWVDLNVAQVLGIKPEKAAMLKEQGVDLMAPRNREEDAIAIYYRNLIQYNIKNIADRFRAAENMPTFPNPVPVVFSGGTAMAGNFIELVKAVFKEIDFPIPVKEVRLAKDPLNATARGALVAAHLEMGSKK